ncbi:hypothetical protein JCM19046_2302 [Bacillus sp. JCM 19046]|nr:hypothetical protein JCM19045_1870 [Bacillus sp. JCM 19045]GAF17774.1 hypothetical protein JCM19046_2302 [Bacillus sp. JCM 19046]
MEDMAERILATLQENGHDWFSKWNLQGYIPMDSGVLLYVAAGNEQRVVVSVHHSEKGFYDLELLRNNDKFDRIVLGGKYNVSKEQLAQSIDELLNVYH